MHFIPLHSVEEVMFMYIGSIPLKEVVADCQHQIPYGSTQNNKCK